jgi:Na+-driven multidrug efflux pump
VKSTTAVVAVVITVLGDLALVPAFGFVGAAAASTAAYVAALLCALPVFKRHTGLTASDLLLPRRDDWRLVRRSIASVASNRAWPSSRAVE